MPFLELNGTSQYLSFIETIPPTPGSTVVVNVDNVADSAKMFDTYAGDVSVVDNDIILSNLSNRLKEIGRNQNTGEFYLGAINNFTLFNPAGNERTFVDSQGFSPSALRGNMSTLTVSPPFSIRFELDYSAADVFPPDKNMIFFGDNSGNSVIQINEISGIIRINNLGVNGGLSNVVSATLPVFTFPITILFEIGSTSSQLYFDGVLVDSQTHTATQDNLTDYFYINVNKNDGYQVSSVLFKDLSDDFFYPLDEPTGDDYFNILGNPNGIWNPDPVRSGGGALDENDSNFKLDEGKGTTVFNQDETQSAVIRGFSGDIWQGVDLLVKKIRQSIMVIEV